MNTKIEFNEHNCFARKNQSNEYFKQCPHKKKFGNFCGKHKNYLINKLIPFTVSNDKCSLATCHTITDIDPNFNSNNNDNNNTNNNHLNNPNSIINNPNTTNFDINNLITNNLEEDIINTKNLKIKNETLKTIIKNYQKHNSSINSNSFNEGNIDKLNKIIEGDLKPKNTKNYSKKKYQYALLNPIEYYKNNKKHLSVLDYLYDKNIKASQTQLKNSFNFYKLNKYYKTKPNNKDDLNIFYKDKLSSLFETILYSYLNIEKVILIQKKIRLYLKQSKELLHGPAYYNKSICNNETDFYSFDAITEIPDKYFFSYKDEDNFIYGFHIESFINLIAGNVNVENPYNRIVIKKPTKDKAKQIWLKLNKNKEQSNHINNTKSKDIKTRVKNKCINVLQKIDLFGYQTNINWIMDLSLNRSRNFYKSIKAYWEYKAELSEDVKIRIVPFGNPFLNINRNRVYNINKYVVLETILDLINIIISSGNSEDDKNQGCILVLMALNEINRDCGRSNNWLM